MISFGECPFSEDGVAKGSDDCGVEQKIVGPHFIYSIKIKNHRETGLITRRRPFETTVACTYDITADALKAETHIAPTVEEIVGSVENKGEFKLSLDVYDSSKNIVKSGDAYEVPVGDEVTLVASGGGEGFNARMINCWTTMDQAGMKGRYDLLKNSCPVDATVTTLPDERDQWVIFDSFAYSNTPGGKVYLHCDLEACPVSKKSCGVCNEASMRKRRASPNKMAYDVTKQLHVYFSHSKL